MVVARDDDEPSGFCAVSSAAALAFFVESDPEAAWVEGFIESAGGVGGDIAAMAAGCGSRLPLVVVLFLAGGTLCE